MRTYSRADRAPLATSEPPSKRRRISESNEDELERDTPPSCAPYKKMQASSHPISSPLELSEVSSDDIEPASTPPSSAPPSTAPAVAAPQRNAFALLMGANARPATHKLSTQGRNTLSEVTGNAHSSIAVRAKSKENPRSKPVPLTDSPVPRNAHDIPKPSRPRHKVKEGQEQSLTQLCLDLGQPVSKRCKTCGMNYTVSNAEDVALHKKFHAHNVGGIDLGRAFVESGLVRDNIVWRGDDGVFVIEVSRKDGRSMKSKVQTALDVVNRELGAVGIDNSVLWGQVQQSGKAADGKVVTRSLDRFKAYMCVKGPRCVALCLAERIEEARPVIPPDGGVQANSAICVSEKKDAAILGISRIWTSSDHRKRGLAAQLLSCAQESFRYGIEILKREMAFSQPTESGARLAKKWFGQDIGWHVYDA